MFGRRWPLAPPWTAAAGVCAGLALVALVDPREQPLSPPCPFRLTTGWWCPFCGGTRAASRLVRGDVGAVGLDHRDDLGRLGGGHALRPRGDVEGEIAEVGVQVAVTLAPPEESSPLAAHLEDLVGDRGQVVRSARVPLPEDDVGDARSLDVGDTVGGAADLGGIAVRSNGGHAENVVLVATTPGERARCPIRSARSVAPEVVRWRDVSIALTHHFARPRSPSNPGGRVVYAPSR